MNKKRFFSILIIIVIIILILLLKGCYKKDENLETKPKKEEKISEPIDNSDNLEIIPKIEIPKVKNNNIITVNKIESKSYKTKVNIYSYDGTLLIDSYNTNIEYKENINNIEIKSILGNINYDISKILLNNNEKTIDSIINRSELNNDNTLDIYVVLSYNVTIKTNIKSYLDTTNKTDNIKVKETDQFIDLKSYIGDLELINILVNNENIDTDTVLLSKLNYNSNNTIEITVYDSQYDYLKEEPEELEAKSYKATVNIYSYKNESIINTYDINIDFNENEELVELKSVLGTINYDIDRILVNNNRKPITSKLSRSELNDETNNIDIYVISSFDVTITTNIRNCYDSSKTTEKIKVKENELYINLNSYIGSYELENIIVNNIENDTKTLVLTNKLKYNTENNIEIFVYDNQYDYLLDAETYKFKLFFDIQNINDRLGYVLENSYTFNKGQTKIDITSDILAKNPGGYSDIKEDFSNYTIIRSVVNDIDGNINKPSHFISFENGRFYLIRSHLVGKEDIVNTCDIGLFENYNYKVRFNINVLNNPELNQVIEKDLYFDCTNAKGYSLKDLIGENNYQLIEIMINNKEYFVYEGWRDYSLFDNYNYKSFDKNKTINIVDITYLDPNTVNIDTGVSIRVYHKGEEIEFYNFGIQSLLGDNNNYDIYSYVTQKINPKYYSFKSMTINYQDEVECNNYKFHYDNFLDRDTNHIEIHLEKIIYDIKYVINYTLFDKVDTKTGTFSYNPSDYNNIEYLDFRNIKEINDFILDNIIVNGEKVNNSYNIDYSYLDFTKENTITINCHLNTIYNFKVYVYLDDLTDQSIETYSKNNVMFKKDNKYTLGDLLEFIGVPIEYELNDKIRFNGEYYDLDSIIDLNELESIDQVEYNSIIIHCTTNNYDTYDFDVSIKVLDPNGNEINNKELNITDYKTNKDSINIDFYPFINENGFDNMDSYIVKQLIINGNDVELNDNVYNIYTKYLNKDSNNNIEFILQEKVNTYNINLVLNLGNYYLNQKLNKNIEVTLIGNNKVIEIDKLIKDTFNKSNLVLELVLVNGEKVDCKNNLPREILNKEINDVVIYMTDNTTSKTPSYNAYYEMDLKPRDTIDYQKLDGSNWISYIDDKQLVRNMSIPGSYESGSFAVYKHVKKYVGIMTQAQSNVIKVQFQYGIRAFDITISPDEGGFISINGIPTSQLLSLVLIDLVDCLNEHPGEFVIVNIKHDLDHIYAYETALDTELDLFRYYLINNYDKEYADNLFKLITNDITVGELRDHIGIIFRDNVSPYISNKYNAIVYDNFGKNTTGTLTDINGDTMKIVVQDDYNPSDYFVKLNEVNKLLNYKKNNIDSWVFNNAGGYTVWGLTDFVDLAKEINMNIEGRPSYILQHEVGNYGIIYMNYAGADTVFVLGYQMVDAFGNTMCNTIWQHNFFQDSTDKYYTTNIMDLDISDWDIDDLIDWFLI